MNQSTVAYLCREDEDGREALESVVHRDVECLEAHQSKGGVGCVQDGDEEQLPAR